jgi:hypothetical protein
MNVWKKTAAAIAAAAMLTGAQPAMAAQGLAEDEISAAKIEANKLVPKKRVGFAYRSHADAEVSGRTPDENKEQEVEAEAYLLTPYCNVMSLQIEQGRTGHVDFAALEAAAQTYQLRLRFSCRSLDREGLMNAVVTIRQGRFHEIKPTARRYTTVQRIRESDLDSTSRIRVGLVLDLPASEIAADMPIEVTVTYPNKSFLQFGNLYADGAFDQYDTKAPVFAWTPLHETL